MAFKPLQDRIAVKRDVQDEVSAGGILLIVNEDEKPATGDVLSVGPNVEHVKPGDRILFSKTSGEDIEVDDETILVLQEKHVIGTIT